MTSDALRETRELSRRGLLRNGLLAGLGTATIVAVSAPLAGRARADASAPASGSIPAASIPEQWGWKYCHNCRGMWWPATQNACPYPDDSGLHSTAGSGTYGFYHGTTGTSGWQEGWLWCHNCSGMFYGGNSTDAGLCPAFGGTATHDASGSYAYLAYEGTETGTGQAGWSWCGQCSGLWWSNGLQGGGYCPKNFGQAQHTTAGSGKYLIPLQS